MPLLIRNARVLSLAPRASGQARRGGALGDLGIIPHGDALLVGDRIEAVGENLTVPAGTETLEAEGRVLMPGFVDCHTHACWAGDRLDEWEMKLQGVPYLEILRRGGGIHSTVRAVRAASREELTASVRRRLDLFLRGGTTTVEVKSGYGLTSAEELKMLRAVTEAAKSWPGRVIPTALLGHAVEGSEETFVAQTIAETLPAIHAEFPGIAIDAFCEQGAWSRPSCVALFSRAAQLGHPFRVHADQFNSLGMVGAAVELGTRSVDHLEASTAHDLALLARSDAFGVILPCTGFHTDQRYANARKFVDAGGQLALATNYNPGSALTHSMPFAIALAVRFCGLTPAEAIAASTANAAALLGLHDRGSIAAGQRADLILLRHRDERLLAAETGGNPVDAVICGGQIVSAAHGSR